jgi:flagellar biogenesis protein FliO
MESFVVLLITWIAAFGPMIIVSLLVLFPVLFILRRLKRKRGRGGTSLRGIGVAEAGVGVASLESRNQQNQ